MDAESLVQAMESLAKGDIPANLASNHALSVRLLEASRRVQLKLEDPWHMGFRFLMAPVVTATIKVGVDTGVWKKLVNAGGKAIPISQLATDCKVDQSMLQRLLRFAETQDFVAYAEPDSYIATSVTKTLTARLVETSIAIAVHQGKVPLVLPAWLKKNSYKEPKDINDCPFIMAFDMKPGENILTRLATDPEYGSDFNDQMVVSREGQPVFLDDFPLENYIDVSGKSTDAAFVDIAGGLGHVSKAVLAKHPALKGKITVQDLPFQVEKMDASALPGITLSGYDMFSGPNPIKNAQVYFTRWIWHGFADEPCKVGLKNIRDAMGPNSVLLIDEVVVPHSGGHWYTSGCDVYMMTATGGIERTQRNWDELAKAAGLRSVKTHAYGSQGETVQVFAKA